jgi:hypothetical protein
MKTKEKIWLFFESKEPLFFDDPVFEEDDAIDALNFLKYDLNLTIKEKETRKTKWGKIKLLEVTGEKEKINALKDNFYTVAGIIAATGTKITFKKEVN